jgi:hypothetical protein
VWQALREELHPDGLEIVTVGMDTAGPEACRPFIEAAAPTHPSLVDVGHLTSERFGVVNIPNGVWIDEDGVVVRPAEPAFPPGRGARRTGRGARGHPRAHAGDLRGGVEDLDRSRRLRGRPAGLGGAGSDSPYALGPEEVVARSGRRDLDSAAAAAHFDLAQHLHRAGDEHGAIRHFREAHRLQPENFSYKRQAWSLASPGTGPFERFWQGPVEGREQEWPYEGDWLSEVRAMGAERYYPALDLGAASRRGLLAARPAAPTRAGCTARSADVGEHGVGHERELVEVVHVEDLQVGRVAPRLPVAAEHLEDLLRRAGGAVGPELGRLAPDARCPADDLGLVGPAAQDERDGEHDLCRVPVDRLARRPHPVPLGREALDRGRTAG